MNSPVLVPLGISYGFITIPSTKYNSICRYNLILLVKRFLGPLSFPMPPQGTIPNSDSESPGMRTNQHNADQNDGKLTRLFAQKEFGAKIQRAFDELGEEVDLEIRPLWYRRLYNGQTYHDRTKVPWTPLAQSKKSAGDSQSRNSNNNDQTLLHKVQKHSNNTKRPQIEPIERLLRSRRFSNSNNSAFEEYLQLAPIRNNPDTQYSNSRQKEHPLTSNNTSESLNTVNSVPPTNTPQNFHPMSLKTFLS